MRALDDNSRGNARRLAEVANDIEFIAGDIRDPGAVDRAAQGLDEIHHLAYVNGSQFFYTQPDLVLDVGVRGMVNVIDACRKHGIGKLVLASSSEVYQTPPLIPTDESAPLTIPDPLGSMIDCSWLKAFLVRAGNFTLHRIARVPMHDASNGFRLFSRRTVDEVTIESDRGFCYSIELLVEVSPPRLAHRRGAGALVSERARRQSISVIRWLATICAGTLTRSRQRI